MVIEIISKSVHIHVRYSLVPRISVFQPSSMDGFGLGSQIRKYANPALHVQSTYVFLLVSYSCSCQSNGHFFPVLRSKLRVSKIANQHYALKLIFQYLGSLQPILPDKDSRLKSVPSIESGFIVQVKRIRSIKEIKNESLAAVCR